MITPALFISATGTFILSTSNRLGRCIDHIRALSDQLDRLMHDGTPKILLNERHRLMQKQVELQSKRAMMMRQSLELFYIAAGMFLATSVAISLVSLPLKHYSWVPLISGITGACFLLYATGILIFEGRLAAAGLSTEIEFFNQLAKHQLAESNKREA